MDAAQMIVTNPALSLRNFEQQACLISARHLLHWNFLSQTKNMDNFESQKHFPASRTFLSHADVTVQMKSDHRKFSKTN